MILRFGFHSYPHGILALFPWFLGACGILGLIRSLSEAAEKSALRVRTDIILLVLGLVGAIIATIYWYAVMGLSSKSESPFVWLSVAVIQLFPIAVATNEIRRLAAYWRTKPLENPSDLRRFLLVLLVVPIGFGAARILVQEGVMIWYGREFVSAAYAAADKRSKGQRFCVIDYGGADSFEELDKREILLQAFKKRMGQPWQSRRSSPHFGITVDGEIYWWSFRKRAFLWYRPGVWDRLPPNTCRSGIDY